MGVMRVRRREGIRERKINRQRQKKRERLVEGGKEREKGEIDRERNED